jgi:membrane dipeptidase
VISESDMEQKDILLIDGLIVSKWHRPIFEDMHKAGISAANCTVSIWEDFQKTIDNVVRMKQQIRENADLLRLVRSTSDIRAAKKDNKVGVILGFQNAHAFEDNLGYIEAFCDMGVRIVQLTYNTQNLIGTGCYERDAGLSGYGQEVVEEMNRVGIVVDLSHVGAKTAKEAIEASEKPVCYSHCLPLGLKEHPRNKSDDDLRFIASKGGFVGVTAYPPFMKATSNATVDDYVIAIDYVINLIGEDAVGIGTDFSTGQPDEFRDRISLDKGRHRRLTNLKSETDLIAPIGLADISAMPNLFVAMEKAGWGETRIAKVLGGNWLNFFDAVWDV